MGPVHHGRNRVRVELLAEEMDHTGHRSVCSSIDEIHMIFGLETNAQISSARVNVLQDINGLQAADTKVLRRSREFDVDAM